MNDVVRDQPKQLTAGGASKKQKSLRTIATPCSDLVRRRYFTTFEKVEVDVIILHDLKLLAPPALEQLKENLGRVMRERLEGDVFVVKRLEEQVVHALGALWREVVRDEQGAKDRFHDVRQDLFTNGNGVSCQNRLS